MLYACFPEASGKELTRANQINYRMRVTLTDGRQMTGQMLAFDKVSWKQITWEEIDVWYECILTAYPSI